MTSNKVLLKKQERVYTELTSTFTDKKQFTLLNELIEIEIELEGRCGE
jgi:hypothetical protein